MENKGKAYAHKSGQRQGDLYHTPKSLVWVSYSIIKREFTGQSILEPCAGAGAISEELKKYNYFVTSNDLYIKNKNYINMDYLQNTHICSNQIITNPPFSLWDEFVLKAKTHCKKFMFIGRANCFGSSGRDVDESNCNNCKFKSSKYGYCDKYNKPVSKVSDDQCILDERKRNMKNSFIWKNLKHAYFFNRYVDYQTPYRKDGDFHVGSMQTGWFIWDKDYTDKPNFDILDVQKYATLGNFK